MISVSSKQSDFCALLSYPFQAGGLVNAPRQKVRLIIEFILFIFLLSGNTACSAGYPVSENRCFMYFIQFSTCLWWARLVQYLWLHHSPEHKSTQDKFSSALLTESISQFYILPARVEKQLPLPTPQALISGHLIPSHSFKATSQFFLSLSLSVSCQAQPKAGTTSTNQVFSTLCPWSYKSFSYFICLHVISGHTVIYEWRWQSYNT